MRWFNDAANDADDETWDRISRDYYAHVRAIAESLPPDLARLALEPSLNLHDATFERVEIDVDRATTTIVVKGGHLGVGYRRITTGFTGATIVPDNLQRLAYAVGAEFRPNHWILRRGVTVILDQEVDLLPEGRYALRLRLWPFHEFAVEFDGFLLAEQAVDPPKRSRGGEFVLHRATDS